MYVCVLFLATEELRVKAYAYDDSVRAINTRLGTKPGETE